MMQEYFAELIIRKPTLEAMTAKEFKERFREIEKKLDSEIIWKPDMYAVSMGAGFVSGYLPLSPRTGTGPDSIGFKGYSLRITHKALEKGLHSLKQLSDFVKKELKACKIEIAEVITYRVTATDVLAGYSIIQKGKPRFY